MKHLSFLFFMALMMAFSSSSALAEAYNSLKFTSVDGRTYTVASENLIVTIDRDDLTFNNTDLALPLASLAYMEFVNEGNGSSSVAEVGLESAGAVNVFDINGASIGSFGSFSEALTNLARGIYVITDKNGNPLKVSVGK